jgi:hypothetical protein
VTYADRNVVFMLPAELRALCLHNRARLYALLISAAAQTLFQLGMDPKRLCSQLGITAVLNAAVVAEPVVR